LLSLPTNTQGEAMVRSILAAVLLITLVSITSAGAGYKKKIFLKYAMNNLFVKCIGQQANDKFILEYIKAAKKCHNREFDAQLKPVYIKPYPVEGQNYYNTRFTSNPVGYHTHPQQQQYYNQQPQQQYQQQPQYQQFQQQPQYQQQQNYVQQPQYQQQQFKQPQYGFQQPQQFYGPGFGFQPIPNQVNPNQVLNRQTRQANKNKNNKKQNVGNKVQNSVVAETNVAGEAELYYYNKLKHHLTGKVGNFSCIMHEMGYFTEDNEINLEKYKQAYQELTLPDAMKEEFIQNIDLCQEVSECLPEKCFAKYPYGREYGRSFFFVMCEKKKAMEVCLKKQMIDDYYKYKDILADDEIHDDLENDEDLFSMGLF
jgi:hypothetical protein